jgi:hypothetical protein
LLTRRANKRKVHFVHLYKFHKETHELYSYRSFIRDYDGAIKEMNITKKILTDDLTDGITGNLPPRQGRQRYFREDHYNLSSENKEAESDEEDKKSGDDSPLKKSMDSKFLLKEDIQSRSHSNNGQSDDNDDALISNQMDNQSPDSRHRDEEEK